MSRFILNFLIIFLVLQTFRNFKAAKDNRQGNEYVKCYKAMLADDPEAYGMICSYHEKETDPMMANRSCILKMHEEMIRGLDYTSSVNEFSYKKCFYRGDRLDAAMLKEGSDVFVWMLFNMARAKMMGDQETLDTLYHKFDEVDFSNQLVYPLLTAAYNGFNGQEDITFLNDLLEGNYEGLQYDKRVVGVFKQLAIALNDYFGVEVHKEDADELTLFAQTSLGGKFMDILGNRQKYLPESEESAE